MHVHRNAGFFLDPSRIGRARPDMVCEVQAFELELLMGRLTQYGTMVVSAGAWDREEDVDLPELVRAMFERAGAPHTSRMDTEEQAEVAALLFWGYNRFHYPRAPIPSTDAIELDEAEHVRIKARTHTHTPHTHTHARADTDACKHVHMLLCTCVLFQHSMVINLAAAPQHIAIFAQSDVNFKRPMLLPKVESCDKRARRMALTIAVSEAQSAAGVASSRVAKSVAKPSAPLPKPSPAAPVVAKPSAPLPKPSPAAPAVAKPSAPLPKPSSVAPAVAKPARAPTRVKHEQQRAQAPRTV
jgi:hypothetical protein